jgi:hypothetical protein
MLGYEHMGLAREGRERVGTSRCSSDRLDHRAHDFLCFSQDHGVRERRQRERVRERERSAGEHEGILLAAFLAQRRDAGGVQHAYESRELDLVGHAHGDDRKFSELA